MNPKNQPLFSGFAGVALADILANSVAVLIIMIVTVIMIKHEQEQTKIDQTEEVSVLLSRKIASSVVMNALPTSAPARLHDYKNSHLDINPYHNTMPILELHDNQVRNFYTGETFSYDELLLPNNRLDLYLRTLGPQQLKSVRIDLYHIRLFYIVMSILKSHETYPKHWHFLTYPKGTKMSKQIEGFTQIEKPNNKETKTSPGDPSLAETGENAMGANVAFNQYAENGLSKQSRSPKNVSLLLDVEGNADYPFDDLAFASDADTTKVKDPSDLPGSSGQRSGQQETSDAIFAALSGIMAETGSRNFRSANASQLMRFRSARPQGNRSRQQGHGVFQMPKNTNMATLLRALFTFMEHAQKEIDTHQSYNLSQYDFVKDVVGLISQLPPENDPKMIAFFYVLSKIISTIPNDTTDQLLVNTEHNPEIQGKVLTLPVNQRLQQGILETGTLQETDDELPNTVLVTSRAGLYPEIYKGIRVPVKKDALILVPENNRSGPYEFGWKIVTFVSPRADDFVTTLVYAAFDTHGQLLLSADENAIKISNLRVESNYPPLPLRKERWQIFLYGIAAMLVTFVVIRRFRKIA